MNNDEKTTSHTAAVCVRHGCDNDPKIEASLQFGSVLGPGLLPA